MSIADDGRVGAEAALNAAAPRPNWSAKHTFVAPYLFEVRDRRRIGIRPVKEREIIRATPAPRCVPHTCGKQGAETQMDEAPSSRSPAPNMYRYDEFDAQFVSPNGWNSSRGQVARRLSGELTEDQFKPLRLMNGVYLQLHAYMLRIAGAPYGTLSSKQVRKLAHIARTYDKNFGHFTTRQNIQYNWIKLVDVPALLRELAEVEMHAIQTSGNCIRNVTADQFAGATDEEIEDPRPLAEIIRQWSSLHPEFVYLPRKFKIAVGGAVPNMTAPRCEYLRHGRCEIVKNAQGRTGYKVLVGGGMGRTPYIAQVMREFVEKEDIISPIMEAVLRVYNEQDSRRDNIYKARLSRS